MLLKTHTTMKIGGPAEKILKLSECVRDFDLLTQCPKPIRFLGNGSNTLIDDAGLKGTVVLTRDSLHEAEPKILSSDVETAVIEVSAGHYLPNLSRWSVKAGLSGCEYMIGVPGTIGGALVQNAGANEQEFADILIDADVWDRESQQLRKFTRNECQLVYRGSLFKHNPRFLICAARLRLKKKDPKTIEEFVEKNLRYRKEKTPFHKPSLGSVFTRLKDADGGWIYPGKLIEDCGLKGLTRGKARVSEVHANYIVNEGGATFAEVCELIHEIERIVVEKMGIKLTREIEIWTDRPEFAEFATFR